MGQIRVVAVAVIRRPQTGELLVFEGSDPGRGLVYHRPLGGGVEFGETAHEAVVREVREELGVDITPRRTLAVDEALFEAFGERKHEVAFLIDCAFVDRALYARDRFQDMEGNGNDGFWRRPEDPTPLFPLGLGPLLRDLA